MNSTNLESVTTTTSVASPVETSADSEFKNSFQDDFDQQKSVIKVKEEELKAMQNQIENYNQMAKQLAGQREMAVKKLAEMDGQIDELKTQLERERIQVEAKDQELRSKRTLLQALKNEENELKEKFHRFKRDLNTTNEKLTNMKMIEAQVKTKLLEYKEFIELANNTLDDIEKAIEHKDTVRLSALSNQVLTPPPLSINSLLTNGIKPQNTSSASAFGSGAVGSPTQLNNQQQNNENDSIFDSAANFDPFADDDPFVGDDPFKSEDGQFALNDDDPFNPAAVPDAGLGAEVTFRQNDPFAP